LAQANSGDEVYKALIGRWTKDKSKVTYDTFIEGLRRLEEGNIVIHHYVDPAKGFFK